VLNLDPQHEIRWLDLCTAPGVPATRIRLDQRVPSPDITVAGTAASPGELLADVIAARMLALASAYPQESPERLAPAWVSAVTASPRHRLLTCRNDGRAC
jgi:hypothetical protein